MKMIRRETRLLSALLIAAVLLTACNDADLKTVAKALDDSAHAVAVLQTTVIAAADQKLITDAAAAPYMELSVRVNLAGKDAVAVTRRLNALAPADRSNLLAILAPVVAQVAATKALPLDNSPTGQKIRAALLLIETALNTAQIALASR